MAEFVRGDVVVVPFPFSDLTRAKRRPALIIAAPDGDDFILCQITSKAVKDSYAAFLDDDDFLSGSLRQSSNIRPNRIFTADRSIILYSIGRLKAEKFNDVVDRIISIVKGNV